MGHIKLRHALSWEEEGEELAYGIQPAFRASGSLSLRQHLAPSLSSTTYVVKPRSSDERERREDEESQITFRCEIPSLLLLLRSYEREGRPQPKLFPI